MRQIRDGIAGGVCALLPLLVVNTLGYVGLLNSQDALLAGALALLAGPPVGGVVAGLLGSRPRAREATAAGGALTAGSIAGGMYLAVLLGVVVVAAQIGAEPLLLAEHPLRVGGALVCLATVLAAIALGVGALVGRGSAQRRGVATGRTHQDSRRPSAATSARFPSHPPGTSGRTTRRHAATESSGYARASAPHVSDTRR